MFNLQLLTEQNKKTEIELSLKKGADVNQQNSNGQTTLYIACFLNRVEIVRILLQTNNIHANLQNIYEYTPFLIACVCNKYQSVLVMIQDARVNVHWTNKNGWSPLICACYRKNVEIVKLLLSFGRGVSLYKKTTRDFLGYKAGLTALDIAKKKNKTDVVQVLEEYIHNPIEMQKTLRKQLKVKGKTIK